MSAAPEGRVDGRSRWARSVVALTAVPLLVLCAAGVTWRYAAVLGANLVPLLVLAAQLRRRTGSERTAWVLMLLGTAALATHNAQNVDAVVRLGVPAGGPGAAATLALGYGLLLAGGMATTLRFVSADRAGMLDAAVIGLAVASLMWTALLHPAHERLGSDAVRVAYEMSLLLIVTALTGMAARAVVLAPALRPATVGLLVAIATADLSDVTLTVTEDPVTGLSAWWASLPCVVALVAFAVALLDPALRIDRAARADAPVPRGVTPARLAFLSVALGVNPLIAGVQELTGRPVDGALLSLGSLFMVPLVATRIGLLVRRQDEVERRLHDLASLDDLTGLLNRRELIERLGGLLRRVGTGQSPGVVAVYLDLDEFKSVNDTHGHLVGDQLLCAVASRLRARVRSGDVVARCGGDEFVVVVEGDPAVVGPAVVTTVESALAEPVAIGALVASGHASLGVAAALPGACVAAEELLHLADAQMYLVKRQRQEGARRAAPAADEAAVPGPALSPSDEDAAPSVSRPTAPRSIV